VITFFSLLFFSPGFVPPRDLFFPTDQPFVKCLKAPFSPFQFCVLAFFSPLVMSKRDDSLILLILPFFFEPFLIALLFFLPNSAVTSSFFSSTQTHSLRAFYSVSSDVYANHDFPRGETRFSKENVLAAPLSSQERKLPLLENQEPLFPLYGALRFWPPFLGVFLKYSGRKF